jgi:hypothetical protein
MRLFRGTVTWTSTWMFLGRGRCPVPEGVHHGLADPTRELKVLKSPSRGTPSGSRRPREADLEGTEDPGTEPDSLKPPRPLPKPPVPSLMLWLMLSWGLVGMSWASSSKACVVAW